MIVGWFGIVAVVSVIIVDYFTVPLFLVNSCLPFARYLHHVMTADFCDPRCLKGHQTV
jgi:hypothetical protein